MASSRPSSRFALLFVGFWSFVTLIFDGYIAYTLKKQIDATNYNETKGVITSSEVSQHTDSDGDAMYAASLKYTYQVNGQAYTGDRYSYGAMSTSSRSYAAGIVAAHPVGAPVVVYYDQSDPEESTLRQGVDGSALFMTIFMTPFNIVMLGGWVMLVKTIRRRDDAAEPACAGFLRSDDGARATLMFSKLPPIGAAAAAMLGVSFVSIFVVGFTAGFDPSMGVVGGTWVVIVLAGAIGYLRHRGRILRGDYTMVIDRMARRVQLPRQRKANAMDVSNDAAFDHIERIDITIDQQRQVNKQPTRQLHLFLRGASEPVVLTTWLSDADANTVAGWIRGELGLAPA